MELVPVGRLDVEGVPPDQRTPIYDITNQRILDPSDASVCRTCKNRMSRIVGTELRGYVHCEPTEFNVSFRLYRDGKQIRGDVAPSGPYSAIVHSCGWQMRKECRDCTHFYRYTHGDRQISEYGGVRSKVVVGGYCTLPDEGIRLRDGRIVHCLPERRLITNLDAQSCDTCSNCVQAQPWSESQGVMDLDGVIVRTGSDPYEQNRAKVRYDADHSRPTAKEENTRITGKQANQERGHVHSFPAHVIHIDAETTERKLVDGRVLYVWEAHSVTLRFGDRNSKDVKLKLRGNEAVSYETDVPGRVIGGKYVQPHHVVGTVPPGQICVAQTKTPEMLVVHMQLDPWRKKFGIKPVKTPLTRMPSLPYPIGYVPQEDFPERVDPGCPRCTSSLPPVVQPIRACDAHARGLTKVTLYDTVTKKTTEHYEFTVPEARDFHLVPSPSGAATLFVRRNGVWAVESASGQPQHLAVLHAQYRRLSKEARRLDRFVAEGASEALFLAMCEAQSQRINVTTRLKSLLRQAEKTGRNEHATGYWKWQITDWARRLMKEVFQDWEQQLQAGTLDSPGRQIMTSNFRLPMANYTTSLIPIYREIPGKIEEKKEVGEYFWTTPTPRSIIYRRPRVEVAWASGTLEPRIYNCYAYLHGKDDCINLPKAMGIRNMGESFYDPTTQIADVDPRSRKAGTNRLGPTYTTGEFHRHDVDDYIHANDFGARVQEAIDASRSGIGGVWNPDTWSVVKEPFIGPLVDQSQMVTTQYDAFQVQANNDNWPGGYDRKADQVEFRNWLDEVTLIDGLPVSNRWRFYGYEMTGAQRPEHRDVDVDSVWGEDPSWERHSDDEETETLADDEPIYDEAELDGEDSGLDITDAMHEEGEMPWQRMQIYCTNCEEFTATTIAEVARPTQPMRCPECLKDNTIIMELIGDDGTQGGERGYCPGCGAVYHGIKPFDSHCAGPHCQTPLVLIDEGIPYEVLEKRRGIGVYRSSDDKIQRRIRERYGSDCEYFVRSERGANRWKKRPVTHVTIQKWEEINRKRLQERKDRRPES